MFSKLLIVAIALLTSTVTQAAPISGLVNTGAGFGINAQDTNYEITAVSAASIVGPYGYVADHSGWPDASPWISTGTDSRWLTPTSDEAEYLSAGTYRWRLTFDLTGFDSSTAAFLGRLSADDQSNIYLNGTLISSTPNHVYTSWYSFSANTGFIAGLNTLDFIVTNDIGPTGLRVEFLNTTVEAAPAPEPIPEPGSFSLAALAFAALGLRRRKSA